MVYILFSLPISCSEGNVGRCEGYVGGGGVGRYIVWLTGRGVRAIEYYEVG